ncbi:MAG: redoxin family protein [Proteobacteria bacterium]|nr:redoxin family protein [Pseudomonadota bacterium]MBU1714582.1 redoxin family protein [Pseudomonadota bacterium]
MNKTQLTSAAALGIILFIMLFSSNGRANSFPFRSINPGDPLPAITLTDPVSNKALTLDQTNSKNAMIIFWAADNDTKKKRVIKTMKDISKLHDFLLKKNITLYIVDSGNDSPAVISEVMTAAELSLPVYLDTDLKAYGQLGIFVMPSIMLVDQQGKVTAGLGYSRDLRHRLQGEVEIMLGEKDRAQFEQEMRPETVEKSSEEKNAHRHLNQGLAMIQRGQTEAAITEFEKAIALDPGITKAYFQIGCLYVDIGKIDLAKKALDKGLESEPDSLDGQVCRARIKAKEVGIAEAIDDLQFLLLRNSRNANLRYVLATLLAEQGKFESATKEYHSAYNLLLKETLHK